MENIMVRNIPVPFHLHRTTLEIPADEAPRTLKLPQSWPDSDFWHRCAWEYEYSGRNNGFSASPEGRLFPCQKSASNQAGIEPVYNPAEPWW